jgi:heme/copper-type cytochrome/quinol oxidase subunit 2
MTTGKRAALLAAVIVIAVVGFIVLKPEDSSKKASSVPEGAGPSTTAQRQTTGSIPAKPAKPAPPPVIQVRVEGGKPVGGIKKIKVSKGERVRFAVSSDVADEIHVHGYDFMKDVEAGGKVSFSFPAKIDGVFEIELEHLGEQIAELEVQP